MTAPQSGLKVALVLVAIAAGAFVLYRIETVIFAIILAVFFAYLIAPVVFFTERMLAMARSRHLRSRGLAVGLVYLAMTSTIGVAVLALAPKLSEQATGIIAQAPEYSVAIRSWGERWTAYERAKLPADIRVRVDEAIVAATEEAARQTRDSVVATLGLVAYVPWLVLIPVLTFFLLKDLDGLRYYAVQALPADFRGPGYRLVQELNTALAAYVRSQLLACLVVGTICLLGFAVIGVPYAVLLGVLAGVLEFIPLIGPLVVAVITVIVAAVHQPIMAVWVIVFLTILRIVEDYVIYPRLIGRSTHLHPLAIILAVLIGVELGGILGVFLAVPAISTLLVGYRHWIDWRQATAGSDHGVRPRGQTSGSDLTA